MFRVNTQKLFETISVNSVDCEECPYLRSYIEDYEIAGTIDREKEYDCDGCHNKCQQVQDKELDLLAFMADNSHMFQFIEEVQ